MLLSMTILSVGVFYFTLGNIHPRFRSKLKMIHLVAICKTRYIQKYSLNVVLEHLVQDIKKLVNIYILMYLPIFIA